MYFDQTFRLDMQTAYRKEEKPLNEKDVNVIIDGLKEKIIAFLRQRKNIFNVTLEVHESWCNQILEAVNLFLKTFKINITDYYIGVGENKTILMTYSLHIPKEIL